MKRFFIAIHIQQDKQYLLGFQNNRTFRLTPLFGVSGVNISDVIKRPILNTYHSSKLAMFPFLLKTAKNTGYETNILNKASTTTVSNIIPHTSLTTPPILNHNIQIQHKMIGAFHPADSTKLIKEDPSIDPISDLSGQHPVAGIVRCLNNPNCNSFDCSGIDKAKCTLTPSTPISIEMFGNYTSSLPIGKLGMKLSHKNFSGEEKAQYLVCEAPNTNYTCSKYSYISKNISASEFTKTPNILKIFSNIYGNESLQNTTVIYVVSKEKEIVNPSTAATEQNFITEEHKEGFTTLIQVLNIHVSNTIKKSIIPDDVAKLNGEKNTFENEIPE